MAPAMNLSLRADPVLIKDGQDLLDCDDLHLLILIRNGGTEEAAADLKITKRTVLQKVRRIEHKVNGKVLKDGTLSSFGTELVERMELYVRLLEAQLENLWKNPSLTCDGLVLRKGKVLLVQRGREPFQGCHALPGGFVEYGESTEDCVVREIKEETGLETEIVRLVGVYSEMGRDPRGHFVTLLYLLRETGGKLKAGDDADSAKFFALSDLPDLAFDHGKMIADGLKAAEHPL
ncbi:MAG: NUDIX domain-containing protein [Methanomassiliicoccales archaeon]